MKKFRRIIFLATAATVFSLAALGQSDTRNLSVIPKEVYGDPKHNIKIRLGNGGAGPTGILRALAEDYLQQSGNNYAIAWYQDISPNTLKQLQNGIIDIALVYEKTQGKAAMKQGWATGYSVIFNDHFLIVGPKQNPAKIKKADSTTIAFLKISRLGKTKNEAVFLSRDDDSGTNIKEKSIWQMARLKPWESENAWYFKYHVFPKEALLYADKNSLYTLTDWGTWLSNEKDLNNSQIFLQGKKELLNPCFALLGKNPSPEVLDFLKYLKSKRAQKLIADFGKDKYEGRALFTPAKQANF